MDTVQYWKTNLCKELSLSGSYIYNGLKVFDDMEVFYYEEEIFEFLYAISVGIERLQKTAIILKENVPPDRQKEFEKELKTHNHLELMKRITKTEQKDVSSLSYAFLQLLAKFYKTWRYDRYILSDNFHYDKEKQALIAFIEKHLKIEIRNEILNTTPNDIKYKRFVGRTVGKIISYLYEIIKRESCKLNVFTYEIRVHTKAYKIFVRKEYDFINEDIFWKELLIYILNNVDNNEYLGIYRSIQPLDFDDGLLVGMIKGLKSDLFKQENLDSLEYLYDEIKNKKARFDFLNIIGNDKVYLCSEDEADEGNAEVPPGTEFSNGPPACGNEQFAGK
jgi:hypothetical protein